MFHEVLSLLADEVGSKGKEQAKLEAMEHEGPDGACRSNYKEDKC